MLPIVDRCLLDHLTKVISSKTTLQDLFMALFVPLNHMRYLLLFTHMWVNFNWIILFKETSSFFLEITRYHRVVLNDSMTTMTSGTIVMVLGKSVVKISDNLKME